jgi:hypothetical protein
MVGHRINGLNVFGGGLALFDDEGYLIGSLRLDDDTSCMDHISAWKIRDMLGLDDVFGGISETGDDYLVHNAKSGWNHAEFGAEEVEISTTPRLTIRRADDMEKTRFTA